MQSLSVGIIFKLLYLMFLVNICIYDFAQDEYFLQMRTQLDDFPSC